MKLNFLSVRSVALATLAVKVFG